MASIEAKERVVRPEAVRAFAGRLRRRIAGLEAVLGRRLPPAGGRPRVPIIPAPTTSGEFVPRPCGARCAQ